ncbi:MAG: heme-binding protein [Rhodomicrobium sp.]
MSDVGYQKVRQVHRKPGLADDFALAGVESRLLALSRMDGAYETVGRLAVGKAVVSARTGLPNGEVVSSPDYSAVATAVGEGSPAACIQGGLPILGQGGEIEGACGVAGAPHVELDEECARAGIAGLR